MFLCVSSFHNQYCLCPQGEDVALPAVPTEPIPEVPEAVKAEPGIIFTQQSITTKLIYF